MSKFWAAAASDDSSSSSSSSDESSSSGDSSAAPAGRGGGAGDNKWVMESDSGEFSGSSFSYGNVVAAVVFTVVDSSGL